MDIPLGGAQQNIALSSTSASTDAPQVLPALALSFLRWFDATVLKEIYLSQQPKKGPANLPQVDGFEETPLFAVEQAPSVSMPPLPPANTAVELPYEEPAPGFWGSAYNKLAELIRGKREKQLPNPWV